MLFLLNRFFGGRYAPFLRAGLGVAFVVVGIIASSKVVLIIGCVFIIWGLITGIGALTRRGGPPNQSGGGHFGSGR